MIWRKISLTWKVIYLIFKSVETSERLVTMKKRYYANEQYSRRECLETSSIPASVADKDLEILEETDVPIDPTLVEECHCWPSKVSPKKVIVKLNCRKDIHRILLNRNKLKNLKPESVHLQGETKVLINESLCLYFKKLWSKYKKLWSAGHISAFWVRNGSSHWLILIFLVVLISISK